MNSDNILPECNFLMIHFRLLIQKLGLYLQYGENQTYSLRLCSCDSPCIYPYSRILDAKISETKSIARNSDKFTKVTAVTGCQNFCHLLK